MLRQQQAPAAAAAIVMLTRATKAVHISMWQLPKMYVSCILDVLCVSFLFLDEKRTQCWSRMSSNINILPQVTALLGKTAYLNCRVKNLGNKTVSILDKSQQQLLEATAS